MVQRLCHNSTHPQSPPIRFALYSVALMNTFDLLLVDLIARACTL